MPEPLKNEFNQTLVQQLGNALSDRDPSFDLMDFETSIINDEWEGRELKERMRHITMMIHAHSKLDYVEQLPIMVEVSAQFGGLFGMTFPDYVEVFGLDYLEASLDALEHMTRYSSSEFAIRPFIVRYPKAVMKRMRLWSINKNEHVRRLASEGCRPRLPWAMALPDFKADPKEIMPILENLRADESLYVRKSVANNLNDITKDNPDIALKFAAKWHGQHHHTNWIIKQGLRTLLKKGDKQALEIIGFNEEAKFEAKSFELSSKQVKLGDSLNFEFQISNLESEIAFAKIGYVISYMKSNGTHSDKIFHITEKEFEPGALSKFNKKISFKDLTTRKHYPGPHHLSIIANGKKLVEQTFELK